MKNKLLYFKPAFSIAEVLITLSIVGVIAVITLSCLIKQYRDYVNIMNFKKSFSLISNAMKKTEADFGYMPECYYALGLNGSLTGAPNNSECIDFHNNFLKNMKVIKVCNRYSYRDGCIADIIGIEKLKKITHPELTDEEALASIGGTVGFGTDNILTNYCHSVVLINGTTIIFYGPKNHPLYIIDTNGKKGPNKWGYDIFSVLKTKTSLICQDYGIEPGGITCQVMLKKAFNIK